MIEDVPLASRLLARRNLWLAAASSFHHPDSAPFLRLLDPRFREAAALSLRIAADDPIPDRLDPGELFPESLSLERLFAALDRVEDMPALHDRVLETDGLRDGAPGAAAWMPEAEVRRRFDRLAGIAGLESAPVRLFSMIPCGRFRSTLLLAETIQHLLASEARAISGGDAGCAGRYRRARRLFFRLGLGRALSALAAKLTGAAFADFYREAGRFTAALCALERAALERPAPPAASAEPSRWHPRVPSESKELVTGITS